MFMSTVKYAESEFIRLTVFGLLVVRIVRDESEELEQHVEGVSIDDRQQLHYPLVTQHLVVLVAHL